MEELFNELITCSAFYKATFDAYLMRPDKVTEEQVLKAKYQFQDALNDYIDKRIELYNRK